MKQQTKPGSALIFTLIILFIGVVAAVGVASTTVISRKMSTTTGKSVASFQVADSGAEIVLQRMKDVLDSDSGATINDLGITCSSGTVSGSINSGKEYRVTFLDENGTQLSAGCNASLSDVQKIRSVGTYAQISRAVEAAVAAEKCTIYSGQASVSFYNDQTHSVLSHVDFPSVCNDPVITTQSTSDSISCHSGGSEDLKSYAENISNNGFDVLLSSVCAVWVGASSPIFKINWIATCGSCK